MLNARAVASVLLVLVVMLAGCVSEETVEEAFPEFELEDGLTNATVSKSMMDGEPWVAYISASWCRHCHPTLDAVDQVIPEDRLLVFNKDPREEYSDMVDWNDDMEASFERDLNRPFIHGPNMSEELGVVGIPHIFYIDGNIEFDRKGIWTNHDEMSQASFERDLTSLHPRTDTAMQIRRRGEHLHAMWSINEQGLPGTGTGLLHGCSTCQHRGPSTAGGFIWTNLRRLWEPELRVVQREV